MPLKKITNEDLETATQKVYEDLRYGIENRHINSAFNRFPENIDEDLIAMKIALIDMTNSTNLNKHLGKIGLNAMVKKIAGSDFDRRMQVGDISLVSELAKWSKEQGVNLFSFLSKYCLYHNVHCYNRDDYSIYDSIVSQHLKDYHKQFNPNFLDRLRQKCDYERFMECIDTVIHENGLTTANVRRKLDWFIWYNNRKPSSTDDK
ncbi:MAG: hypothetical protein LBN34_00465 [Clostridiales Family XIII bacterium]|jgi:hypothetical protein|nr:hypothetical protein [Clostridiales Family XIII bacterium]